MLAAMLMLIAVPGDDLPQFLQPLADADKITFYSIDGTDNPAKKKDPVAETFRGYPVLGKIELKDKKVREQVIQALHQGTQNNTEWFARCFWPRHALRAEKAGKSTDYVICFQCNWIKVMRNDKVEDIVTNKKPAEILNKILKDANIPIAP